MEPSFGGHNFSPFMPEMYHSHNAGGSMATPMSGSRTGAGPPSWYPPMHQHEYMMAANSMEDKKPWGPIPSVPDAALVAPAKDGEKQPSKRSRMNARDDHPSDTSSHGEGASATQPQSSMMGSSSNSGLPVWELAAVLGPGASSLHTGRRSTSERGRGDMDVVGGSKDSSESQDDSEDDGEEGDDKGRDRTSKQQMNRKAAQMSRRRKKERIQELEQNVINLSRRNHELKVINDTLRNLLSQRSRQQTQNEQRIMHLLRTKNQQLKQALHELQTHSARPGSDLPHAVIMNAATLLGPDFQFQQLGALPPLAAPPASTPSNTFMGMVSQQYPGGSMFPPGMDGLGSLSDAHHSTYPHGLQPQNRNVGMNVPPMMMPQMAGGMEMGMGSFIRPPHANQPGMRHDMDSYASMGMNRMPPEQPDLPGIVQSTKL